MMKNVSKFIQEGSDGMVVHYSQSTATAAMMVSIELLFAGLSVSGSLGIFLLPECFFEKLLHFLKPLRVLLGFM